MKTETTYPKYKVAEWPKFRIEEFQRKDKIITRVQAVRCLDEKSVSQLENGNPVGVGINDSDGNFSGRMVRLYTPKDAAEGQALALLKIAEACHGWDVTIHTQAYPKCEDCLAIRKAKGLA